MTEVGRQPWLVTGLLRTKDAVGEITGAQLGASLTGYILTYAALFIAYMVVLTHMSAKGAAAAKDDIGPAYGASATRGGE